jgi:hypothetical protein
LEITVRYSFCCSIQRRRVFCNNVSFVLLLLEKATIPYLALPIFAGALFQAQQAPYLATIAKKRLELARANNSVRAE